MGFYSIKIEKEVYFLLKEGNSSLKNQRIPIGIGKGKANNP